MDNTHERGHWYISIMQRNKALVRVWWYF